MIKKMQIGSIADIRFGLYTQSTPTGEAAYLQVRQFTENGLLTTKTDEYINIDYKTAPHLLQDGDVLFVGKGSRLFACCYQQNEQPAIASSIFFVLKPNIDIVYPAYLAAILNAPQSKAVFQQIGAGTNIFSIRKSELSAFQIPVPSINQQMQIAALAELHQREIYLAYQLIEHKQNLYASIMSKLAK